MTLISGHPAVIQSPSSGYAPFNSGAPKLLKQMVPEVGLEPTRGVNLTGF